jgi:hypothetical protein
MTPFLSPLHRLHRAKELWLQVTYAITNWDNRFLGRDLNPRPPKLKVYCNISNKSPTRCNNFPVDYPDVYLQLNMFRAFSRPSSGAQWLQWQHLVLPSYRGDRCAMFVVGPAGPTTNTARLSPRYEGKTRCCHCSHWAPDDGRENARNMLSCKYTSG